MISFSHRNKEVLEFATEAHKNQIRKYTKEPYITHPVAVAELIAAQGADENMISAALLHDVIEDTTVTHRKLRVCLHEMLPPIDAEDVLGLVVELTDVYTKEDFQFFNRKIRKRLEAKRLSIVSDRAKQIKKADISHNSESILEYDPQFAKVFLSEKEHLLKLIS
jgi:(p)ppGpp synthase/HD superfamily hydrolase